jgi:salicylate hydroxylase
VHSVVRQAIYGDQKPTYTGQMVWRAMVDGRDVPADLLDPSGHIRWVGPGRHFFGYYLRGREVINIVTQEDTDEWVGESWNAAGGRGRHESELPRSGAAAGDLAGGGQGLFEVGPVHAPAYA